MQVVANFTIMQEMVFDIEEQTYQHLLNPPSTTDMLTAQQLEVTYGSVLFTYEMSHQKCVEAQT